MSVKIGVFDSGKGGLSLLHQLQKDFPDCTFEYLADTQGFPYSEKSVPWLQDRVTHQVQQLIEKGCNPIVIACNTATVTSLSTLREAFPHIQFIGTVPAIAPAIRELPHGSKILIVATKNTAQSEYLAQLIAPHENDFTFIKEGRTDLVTAIENGDEKNTVALISELADTYAKNIQGIVLGCTHFPLVLPLWQKYFPKVKCYSSEEGISRQVRKVLYS